MKRNNTIVAGLGLILCVSTFSTLFSIPTYSAAQKKVSYNETSDLLISNSEENLFIYEDSSFQGEVIGMMEEGNAAYVLDESDNWYHVVSGNYTGYMKKKYLLRGEKAIKKAVTYCSQQVTVVSDTVFLNTSSDMNGTVLALYVKGQKLEMIEEGEGWFAVSDSNGLEGFLLAKDVSTQNIYTFAIDPDIELYCELYPDEALASYGSNDAYDDVQGTSDYYTAIETIDVGQQVCDFALQFVGNPYVWGGESLENGCDCSGFIMKVYEHFDIALPHSSYEIRNYGSLVCKNLNEDLMQPGDVICYDGHVSLYLGNGKVISAASKKSGICIADINYRTDYICVRRFVSGAMTRTIALTDSDRLILNQIVEAEAGNQGFWGKVYVANVILNRMLSDKFPDTVKEIVYSSGQFSPVQDGRFYLVNISNETINAVEYAVTHADNSFGALYFMNPVASDDCNINWFNTNLTYLFSYKNHAFYK